MQGVPYMGFHRQRLVAKLGVAEAIAHGVRTDIGFDEFVQCEEKVCNRLKAKFETKDALDARKSCLTNKFAIDVDGNTFSKSVLSLLHCGVLVFKAGIFSVWHDDAIRPWEHYIPIDLDFQDLENKVKWAQNHIHEATSIATEGAIASVTRVRRADMECYMSRLLLEYARLLPRNQSLANI